MVCTIWSISNGYWFCNELIQGLKHSRWTTLYYRFIFEISNIPATRRVSIHFHTWRFIYDVLYFIKDFSAMDMIFILWIHFSNGRPSILNVLQLYRNTCKPEVGVFEMAKCRDYDSYSQNNFGSKKVFSYFRSNLYRYNNRDI